MTRREGTGSGNMRRGPACRLAGLWRWAARRAVAGEAGDTLIEILVAIVIIAITVTALLGGLVTAITSSATEQTLSTEDSIVNGFAQAAQFEIQQASAFKNCTPSAYRLISTPFPSAGPVGSNVTVFVTGLAADHPLKAHVGSSSATIVSGSSTDASGDAAVTFAVPPVSGAQTVSVDDGTGTPVSSPTPFTVSGSTKGTTPTGYKVSINPVQQWDPQAFAQGASPWLAATSPTCPDSGTQLITVLARGPDGSVGSLSFVALGSATTTVLVSGAPVSPILGDTITFTATVVPPTSTTPVPVGSVGWQFSQSPGSPSCADSTLSTVAGTNTASATCTVSAAQVGTYSATASYPAPGTTTNNYGPGSGTGTITVGKADSSTTVTEVSSPMPAQPGSRLTFSATVGASPAVNGDPKPSGPVVWSVTGPGGVSVSCQGLTDNTYDMASGGTGTNTATCVVPSASLGSYSATAAYGGDGNYKSATSAPISVRVQKATPTIGFTTSPPDPQAGDNVAVTATVDPPNGGAVPTGSITWSVTDPSGASVSCSRSTLDAQGSATCTVANALPGTYTVTASYGGDGTYNPATGTTHVIVLPLPAGADIQAPGNQDGTPDNGDTIVYTYNQAMSLGSILANWSGKQVGVVAAFTSTSGQTQLTIRCSGSSCSGPNLGTVALGDGSSTPYLSGGASPTSVDATMVASTNAAGETVVTVTLTGSSPSFNTVSGTTTLTWTPSTGATSAATNTACAPTAVTETGSPELNF